MKLEKLKNKIKEKGLKYNYIASNLNITPTAFGRKMKGKNMFTIEEMKKLSNILMLSDSERLDFFLK